MRMELRRAGKAFGLYLVALLFVVGSYAALGQLGFTELTANAALPVISKAPEREKTRLEIVVTSAREIRAALAKPVTAIEPLGPIKIKAANALGGPGGAAKLAAKEQKMKISTEAKEAFASSSIEAPRNSEVFDRHRPM